jgi:hypothetical protein
MWASPFRRELVCLASSPVLTTTIESHKMADILTPDKVKSALAAFWALWKQKSADGIAEVYSSNSMAFRVESTRLEPSMPLLDVFRRRILGPRGMNRTESVITLDIRAEACKELCSI